MIRWQNYKESDSFEFRNKRSFDILFFIKMERILQNMSGCKFDKEDALQEIEEGNWIYD